MRNDPFRLDRVDEKRKDASTLGGRGQQFRLRRGRLAEYIGFEAAEGSTTFYEYLERIPCLANDRQYRLRLADAIRSVAREFQDSALETACDTELARLGSPTNSNPG